jgi:hypothetical protein
VTWIRKSSAGSSILLMNRDAALYPANSVLLFSRIVVLLMVCFIFLPLMKYLTFKLHNIKRLKISETVVPQEMKAVKRTLEEYNFSCCNVGRDL